MRLSTLLNRDLPNDVEVTGLTSDSRKVASGDLFIAYQGTQFDSHNFVNEALTCGAVAVLAERQPDAAVSVPWIVDKTAAKMRSSIAARYYGKSESFTQLYWNHRNQWQDVHRIRYSRPFGFNCLCRLAWLGCTTQSV